MANDTPPPVFPDPTPDYPQLPTDPDGSWLAQNRKSAILGGIVLLLGLAIAAVSLLQNRTKRPGPTANANTQNVNQSAAPTATSSTNRPTFRRYEAVVTPDQDRDGLTDADEQAAGTKPDAADSDGDGLSDYDEVKVYRTNATKQDSDADGRTDNQEVTAGTNPNGTGALLNLPQAIQQLNTNNSNQ